MADLDASVVEEAQARAADVMASADDQAVYWKTVRLHDLFTNHLIESATASDLFFIRPKMTDIWALDPEWREEAAALMREAARDLASARDGELDAYVVRWNERLGFREQPRSGGRRSRLLGWLRRHS